MDSFLNFGLDLNHECSGSPEKSNHNEINFWGLNRLWTIVELANAYLLCSDQKNRERWRKYGGRLAVLLGWVGGWIKEWMMCFPTVCLTDRLGEIFFRILFNFLDVCLCRFACLPFNCIWKECSLKKMCFPLLAYVMPENLIQRHLDEMREGATQLKCKYGRFESMLPMLSLNHGRRDCHHCVSAEIIPFEIWGGFYRKYREIDVGIKSS